MEEGRGKHRHATKGDGKERPKGDGRKKKEEEGRVCFTLAQRATVKPNKQKEEEKELVVEMVKSPVQNTKHTKRREIF